MSKTKKVILGAVVLLCCCAAYFLILERKAEIYMPDQIREKNLRGEPLTAEEQRFRLNTLPHNIN